MQAWLRCFLLADDLNFGHCFSRWSKISKSTQDPPQQSHANFLPPRPSNISSTATCQSWAACISCDVWMIDHHSCVSPLGSLHLLYFDLFYPLSRFPWTSAASTLGLPLAGAVVSALRSGSWLTCGYLFILSAFICSVILVGVTFFFNLLYFALGLPFRLSLSTLDLRLRILLRMGDCFNITL